MIQVSTPQNEPMVTMQIERKDSGEAAEVFEVGRTFEALQKDLAERLTFADDKQKKDFLIAVNARDLDKHIESTARTMYCEQFDSMSLLCDVRNELVNMDVNDEITISIKVMQPEEWVGIWKRAEAEAAEEAAEE